MTDTTIRVFRPIDSVEAEDEVTIFVSQAPGSEVQGVRFERDGEIVGKVFVRNAKRNCKVCQSKFRDQIEFGIGQRSIAALYANLPDYAKLDKKGKVWSEDTLLRHANLCITPDVAASAVMAEWVDARGGGQVGEESIDINLIAAGIVASDYLFRKVNRDAANMSVKDLQSIAKDGAVLVKARDWLKLNQDLSRFLTDLLHFSMVFVNELPGGDMGRFMDRFFAAYPYAYEAYQRLALTAGKDLSQGSLTGDTEA